MVREITKTSEFLDLIKRNNICENAYLSYEYFSVLCKYHNPENNGFLCLVVEDDETIIGMLPLLKRGMDYVILGYRYSNYLGYVCKKEHVATVDDEIREYIKNNHSTMIITYYDINNREELFSILDNDLLSKKCFLYNCPFCDVTDDFETVFKRQITKSKKRSELKKFRNKTNALGRVEYLDIDNSDKWEKGKKYFHEIFLIHKERFSDVYIPKDLSLHDNEEYYTELFDSMVKGEKAYISIMLLDDHVISFVYSAVSAGIIMDWMPAFDPAFTKYNLGTVHMMHIMEYICSQSNYAQFDFSKGDGAYKDRWANDFTKSFMFVRRFSNNPIAIIKQVFVNAPFTIKSYLREKGVLKYIKRMLGKQNAKQERTPDSNIKVFKQEDVTNPELVVPFSYNLIRRETIEKRKEIVDRIYNGEVLYIKK